MANKRHFIPNVLGLLVAMAGGMPRALAAPEHRRPKTSRGMYPGGTHQNTRCYVPWSGKLESVPFRRAPLVRARLGGLRNLHETFDADAVAITRAQERLLARYAPKRRQRAMRLLGGAMPAKLGPLKRALRGVW